MNLKKCPKCGQQTTTKDSVLIGRQNQNNLVMLFFNHICETTFTVTGKTNNKKEIYPPKEEI